VCPRLQILALRLLQAVLPSWDRAERAADMAELVEKLFGFLGRLLSTCSSDLPPLRGTRGPQGGPHAAQRGPQGGPHATRGPPR